MTFRTKIIQVGNSQGICIPRFLLEQTGLEGNVELAIRGNAIMIQPLVEPRSGWEEAFIEMAAQGDAALLTDGMEGIAWDQEEWTWE